MLRELHLIDGIGVRTARNIPCTFMLDAPKDRDMTCVISVVKRKTTKTARPEKIERIM